MQILHPLPYQMRIIKISLPQPYQSRNDQNSPHDTWRENFNSKNLNEENFVTYLADKYKENMKSNNYNDPIRDRIVYPQKNVPL